MPLRWRPWRYRRRNTYRRYRRGPTFRRRTRPTFWRTFRRRRRVRRPRNYFFKKLFYKLRKRKLKKLKIFQWQPSSIRRCKIKGFKCLFMCGRDRDSNNYAQYEETYVNPHQPGGGGWSLQIFTLDALWEQHLKCRNWWTKGNKGLPLVRYTGCKFRFFRDYHTDYAVHWSLCYPMLDTPLEHANTAPYTTLITRKRLIVPSKQTQPHGKNYITKRFRPPSQLKNKWYFQADLYKTGLLLLSTVAIDLNNFYVSPQALSNNISIWTLNPKTFTHNGIINIGTDGYHPTASLSIYAYFGHDLDPKLGELHYMGKPGKYDTTTHSGEGKPIKSITPDSYNVHDYFSNPNYWGNLFIPDVLMLNIPVYKTNQQWGSFVETNIDKKISELSTYITRVTEPLVQEVRYNPDRDTGATNKAYLVSIERESTGFNEPSDSRLIIQGFPLYIMLFGWLDWQKKIAIAHNIDSSYIVVIETEVTEPKIKKLIPIDYNFLDGKGPYGLPETEFNNYTHITWWPKVANQLVSINTICNSGPATPKFTGVKQLQAHCHYSFYFKWGGCPAPMVDLLNPALQPKYAVPDNILQRLQIQNPAFQPELELHDFDERRQELTKSCIERIQKFTPTEQTLFSITGPTNPNLETERQKIQKALQTQTEEESEASPPEQNLQQQLHRIHKQQHLLKRAIFQLMRPNIE
nr:MAG: ORF1 [TTV-like mini virus]